MSRPGEGAARRGGTWPYSCFLRPHKNSLPVILAGSIGRSDRARTVGAVTHCGPRIQRDVGGPPSSQCTTYIQAVLERTRRWWNKQDQHGGDRHRLFMAVAAFVDAERVLYPGSYVDLAPTFVWPSVTYVDVDRRAQQFFADGVGVQELLVEHGVESSSHSVRFITADYTDPLDLDEGEFDLLISLYAGFVSEACTRHLRIGGTLLVNPSHGDAAMASIDPRYQLQAVVTSRSGVCTVDTRNLDTYLVPKRDIEVTRESLHASGRGVGSTKTPF